MNKKSNLYKISLSILIFFVGINFSYGATADDDLSFLSDIFGNIDEKTNTGTTNDNLTYSDEVRVSGIDTTYSNEPKIADYSPWGDDNAFNSAPEDGPALTDDIKVSVLPKTGPAEIFLLLLSLGITGAIFYKRRKI